MNARQILSGLGWSTLATVVSGLCQLVFMALLARLLDPGVFGLMAMAGLTLRFAGYFSQLGFAQALIQRGTLEASDTTAALVMATGLGSVLYAVMVLAAPLCATAFRSVDLPPLIDVLGVSLVLGPIGGLPLALLRRQGRFKRVNAIEVVAFVVGYGGVGVGCALLGFGVWSLVVSTLSQQAILLALGFASQRYPLCWPVPREAYARLWRFGSRYSLIGLLEFLGGNIETLFVGRLLGKSELGLFNRAGTLTNLPVELGVNAVNKVLFPALSKLQGDPTRMADGFQMLLLSVGLFSAAMACGIAAGAADIVILLLGAKWAGIAPIVSLLALAVPPTFMFVACGITLDSLAALGPKLRLQALALGVKLALLWALMQWRLEGAAYAVLLTECLRLALGLRLVGRLLTVPLLRLGQVCLVSVGVGGAVGCAVAATLAIASAAGLPLLARVSLEALAGAAVFSSSLLILAVRFQRYAPLQRFETVRQWHGRLLVALAQKVALQ